MHYETGAMLKEECRHVNDNRSLIHRFGICLYPAAYLGRKCLSGKS